MKAAVTVLLVSTLAISVQALSSQVAINLIKLVTSVSFEAPAGNDFIYMAEHGMMDVGIANLIEGMAPKLAPKNACNKFQNDRPGQLTVGPVHKRRVKRDKIDDLQKDILNILDSSEGKSIIDQQIQGKNKVVPPKFASGGFNFGPGKRDVGSLSSDQNELLNILNSAEGKHIIQEKVSGKKLNIPPPRYNSGGVKNIFTKRKRTVTSHLNIAGVGSDGAKNIALLARVRNMIVNKGSLKLFRAALDDGTIRAALYNVFHCNAIASNISCYVEMKLNPSAGEFEFN